MNNKFLMLHILIFCLSTLCYTQSDILNLVSDKTWFFDDDFAGSSITIYTTRAGCIKSIRQIHGSGIPIVNSELYDTKIENGIIKLYNGIDLNSNGKLDNRIYKYNKDKNQMSTNGIIAKTHHGSVNINSWLENTTFSKIDFTMLKNIPLEIGETYKIEMIKMIIE